MRYDDRLRAIASRVQTVQGERLYNLLSWRDPRATNGSFSRVLLCCLCALKVVCAVAGGFYAMRHPRFRNPVPSLAISFMRRLPARTDSLL
ncbi:hypothetical protein ACP275_07G091900 [Erythranthe tilingii]